MSDNHVPVKKYPINELDRYTRFAPVAGNKRASLSFSEREKYPRITVFTRTESDNNGKGVITAAFDIDHFLMFLQQLEAVARSNTFPLKRKITVKHWPRDETGKIKGDKEVSAEVWFGRNDEGVVWLSVVQPNRPNIVFDLTLSEYHEFFDETGQALTKAKGSVMMTLTMANILRQVFIEQCLSFRDTSIPRENKGSYTQRNQNNAQSVVDNIDIDSDIKF